MSRVWVFAIPEERFLNIPLEHFRKAEAIDQSDYECEWVKDTEPELEKEEFLVDGRLADRDVAVMVML